MKWLILGILWNRKVTKLYRGQEKLKLVTWYRPWEPNPHTSTIAELEVDGWYTYSWLSNWP